MSILGMRKFMQGSKLQYFMLALAFVFAIGMVGIMIGTGNAPSLTDDTRGVIAKVNGEKLEREAFELRYRRETDAREDAVIPSAFQESQARGQLFDQMVDQMLRMQAAKKAGVKVGGREVKKKINEYIDMRIAQLKEQVLANRKGKKTDEAFDAALKRSGGSIAQIKAQMRKEIDPDMVRDQLIIEKYFEKLKESVDTSEEAVKAGFDEIRLAQITVGTVGRSAVQAEQRAKDILAKVKAGGDFAKLAQQNSEDPYRAAGGDQGSFAKKLTLPQEIADPAFKLKAGEVGGPVKMADGYVIFKILERRNALPADYSNPKKKKEYRDMYVQQEQYRMQLKAESDMRRAARIDVTDLEIKAYLVSKDISQYLDPSGGTRAKAKAEEAAKAYEKAINGSAGDTQALARCYSSLAYLYYMMAKPALLSPTPQERVDFRKKAIDNFNQALKYTESNELRMTLAELYVENKDYDNALKELKYVSENEFYDKNAHMLIISKYEEMKSARPEVAQLIEDENRWIADYDKRMEEAQAQQSQQTTEPFEVQPKSGG